MTTSIYNNPSCTCPCTHSHLALDHAKLLQIRKITAILRICVWIVILIVDMMIVSRKPGM